MQVKNLPAAIFIYIILIATFNFHIMNIYMIDAL